jgi:DsbC/DsbD-like thiol-disulfide interchange protein
MKKSILSLFILLTVVYSQAQRLDPVSWTFSAKKISEKVFEVHLTASIQRGWHLYSQVQPGDAVAQPTTISINKNPLLLLEGNPKEVGKMEKFTDASIGISAHQYSERVDFVQVVKLKAAAKTNISGIVEFQTCDDKKCLPPKKLNFNVALK